MGIFKKTKASTEAAKTATSDMRNIDAIIVSAHITEKTMNAGEHNVYVFEVARSASKNDIRDAIRKLYGVSPLKVRTLQRQPRREKMRSRGNRTVVHPGMKKAYVYLKKGDTITIA